MFCAILLDIEDDDDDAQQEEEEILEERDRLDLMGMEDGGGCEGGWGSCLILGKIGIVWEGKHISLGQSPFCEQVHFNSTS